MVCGLLASRGMTWQERLRDLVLAGGTLSIVGCTGGAETPTSNVPCGNANPDPCICGRPEQDPRSAALCDQQKACVDAGGTFEPSTCANCGPDGGAVGPHCSVEDAAVTDGAPHD